MSDIPRTPDLVRDLAARGLAVEETHISWVFLDAGHAYKVKKPVDFGFLDFSTLAKRRQACRNELALNRAFEPEVYLDVVPVTRDAEGRHRLGGEGRAVDWAVRMVRLPADRRGDRLLAAGSLEPAWLEALAARLAAFHAAPAKPGIARFGGVEAVSANVAGNFTQSRALLPELLGPVDATLLEAHLPAFLRAHGALLRERAEAGRVRDGHGDLRLGQIYFDPAGQSVLLDRIEFNDRFRYGDVCSDVAFLAMDLAVQGRRDLSEAFLAAYARASGDYDLYALADFYMAYRACVRGKVAALEATLPAASSSPERRSAARGEARRHFRLALDLMSAPAREAPLVAIGGGMAAGKSTLAAALGRRLALPVLDSDRTRKRMAGFDPLESLGGGLFEGPYAPEATTQVYAELRRRAQVILASGRGVIVDASFRARAERAAFRDLARQAGRPFLFVECRAGEDAIRARLRRRAEAPSVSDGREPLAAGFGASWERDPEEEGLVLDTERPLEACVEEALRRVEGSVAAMA